MRRRHSRPPAPRSSFAGFRFPLEVILVAVRWYLRYGLSYRDVEELLAERGIAVDHVTVYRWVQRFTPLWIEAARPCRHVPGDRWFADETYVKVAGRFPGRCMAQHPGVARDSRCPRLAVHAGTDIALSPPSRTGPACCYTTGAYYLHTGENP
jgi:hypothetical protein